MNLKDIKTYLGEKEKKPPVTSSAHQAWVEHNDCFDFLIQSGKGRVPVYISYRNFYLYSIFVPKRRLGKNYITDLLNWNFSAQQGWGYGYASEPVTGKVIKQIYPPLEDTGTTILTGGEPPFFLRESLYHDSSYIEINQKFAHLLELHWIAPRQAYCNLNTEGDLLDIVTVSPEGEPRLCTVERDALDWYMFLTDTALIRVFEVGRADDWSLSGASKTETSYKNRTNALFARRILWLDCNGVKTAGMSRGFQAIRTSQREKTMLDILTGNQRKARRYVNYLAFDIKQGKVRTCSCNPDRLGNYYVHSPFPLGTCPAFFKADVLLKYKQDPDRYTIDSRDITCRGAWSLRYDINEAEQVHVYLCDLGHLPYQEQLYWKSCNEQPRGTIAERAFKTDFLAEWDLTPDPLDALKQTLEEFPNAVHHGFETPIWELPVTIKKKSLARVTAVVTDSVKEWEDQTLALAKVICEGLQEKKIKAVAAFLGCDKKDLKSIKLLQCCLEARGVDATEVQVIIEPLQTVWKLRSANSAHLGNNKPSGDLKEAHRKLLARCAIAMEKLAEVIHSGILNIPDRTGGI